MSKYRVVGQYCMGLRRRLLQANVLIGRISHQVPAGTDQEAFWALV